MKITDHYLRLHLQKCFQPPDRFLQGFYRSKILQISHIRGRIKTVIHTNTEGVLKFSTCCDHLALPGCGNHKRQRRIPAGTADHIGFTLIEIHHRIVGPDTYLPVVGKNAVTEMGKLLCRLRIIFMDKGVIAVEGTPQEVFSSENGRMKEFLGKFHQGME